MNGSLLFSAPTEKPGEVRVYPNRIEIDRKKMFGTTTRAIFFREVREVLHAAGYSDVTLGLPALTAKTISLKRKDDADALARILASIIE